VVFSAVESKLEVRAESVKVTDETITVELVDGRTISVPTKWYPRLSHATSRERANYEINDYGVIWPDVEADFSIRGLLLGNRSGENPQCFRFWLENRKKGRRVTVEEWLNKRIRTRTKRPVVQKVRPTSGVRR
jgi:hypothetical protein